MKKLLFVLTICVLTISSCKKGDDSTVTSNSNLSATINGTALTFNNSLIASNTSGGGSYSLQVLGFNGTAGTSDAMYLVVYSSTPIVAGTYVDGQSATITYNTQPGNAVYSNAISSANPISITITSINSTNVTGTFKGDIFLGANITSTKKVITNGQFNAKF